MQLIRFKLSHTYALLLTAIIAISFGCQPNQEANETVTLEGSMESVFRHKVDTASIQFDKFYKELNSNGRISALQKSNLSFKAATGRLNQINVRNGDFVRKGDVLATLDDSDLSFELSQKRVAFEAAKNKRNLFLIERGYTIADSTKVPKNIWNWSNLESGYSSAINQLALAEHQWKKTKLTAPFDGKIADLVFRPHQRINQQDVFCSLINENEFEVQFSMLESEIHRLEAGLPLEISPFYQDKKYKGHITDINPVINTNGLITVRGKVEQPKGLIDGMNAQVVVRFEASPQLIVPKSAVLTRQEQTVIFKYENGSANWVYVSILGENNQYYAIEARDGNLTSGDLIIVSGNEHLTHQSLVEIR